MRRSTGVVFAVLASLLVVACGTETTSPSPASTQAAAASGAPAASQPAASAASAAPAASSGASSGASAEASQAAGGGASRRFADLRWQPGAGRARSVLGDHGRCLAGHRPDLRDTPEYPAGPADAGVRPRHCVDEQRRLHRVHAEAPPGVKFQNGDRWTPPQSPPTSTASRTTPSRPRARSWQP